MARFLDLSQAPILKSGYDKLPEELRRAKMQRMQMDAMPGQLERQAQSERLKNALLGIEQQYKPQMLESQLGQQQASTELAKQQALTEALRQKFGGNITPAMSEVAQLFEPGTDEYREALGLRTGTPTSIGAQQEGRRVKFSELGSKNEQLDVSKRMRDDNIRSESMAKAYDTLEQMEDIMNKHPDMSDYWQAILIDPVDKSMTGKLKRYWSGKYLGKDKLAALEKYQKLSQDLVLQAGEGLGAKNFTDMKAKLIDISKPSYTNTSEANKYVIQKMKNDFAPWIQYGEELREGLKAREVVERDLNKYRDKPYGIERASTEDLLAQLEGLQ